MSDVQPTAAPAQSPVAIPGKPRPKFEAAESLQRVQQLVDQALKAQSNKPSFVRLIVVVALAAVMLVAIYGMLLPFHATFVGRLFWHQSLFGPAVTFLSTYSVALLLVRYLTIRRYNAAFNLDLLPDQIGQKIGFANAGTFLDYLNRLNQNPGNPLIKRLTGALAHFISKKNTQDVNAYLDSQAASDAHAAGAAYSSVRFIVWLLPILGFIGTVYGIGSAVGGFSGAISSGSDISLIKDSLTVVTTGLGTSFNTTLLALVMSVVVMYPKNIVQKYEESFLVRVDCYCHEEFLRRLEDLVSSGASGGDDFVNAFEQVLSVYQNRWQKECKQLATAIGDQLSTQFMNVISNAAAIQEKQEQRIHELLGESLTQSQKIAEQLSRIQSNQVGHVELIAERLSNAAESIKSQFELVQPQTESSSKHLLRLVELQKSSVTEFENRMVKLSKVQRTIEKSMAEQVKAVAKPDNSSLPPEMLMAFKVMIKELRKISFRLDEKPQPSSQPERLREGWFRRYFGRPTMNGSQCQEISNV